MTTPGVIWIPKTIKNVLLSEAERTAPEETGGILLGYCARSSGDVVVMETIGPGPGAIHRLDRFVPDYDYQERELARIYHESGCRISYLGDWHSHPSGGCELSVADRETLSNIAGFPAARAPEPVMVILVRSPAWVPLAWRGGTVRCFACSQLNAAPVEVRIFRPD